MKITQEGRIPRERTPLSVPSSGRESAAFSQLVQEGQAKLHTETMDRLFTDIEQQAERLGKTRTFAELRRLKRLIRQFVKEAVGVGLDVRHTRDWHRHGRADKLMLVKKIDEKLVEMTDIVLAKHGTSVDLLAKIGEVKGLLINLYR